MSPEKLMELAIDAAKNSRLDLVRPNPRVGAALVTSSGQIAVAAHEKYGTAHAEQKLVAECLSKGWNLKGAKIAVTLEPCNHYGKTPPCSKLLVEQGFSEVYVGVRDPNDKSQGGMDYLLSHGVKVIENILNPECSELNYEWLWAQKHKRPFVRLKMATSLDGKWSAEFKTKEKYITSIEARQYSMGDREKAQVLITGSQTVLDDNPSFLVRDLRTQQIGTAQPECWVLTRQGVPVSELFTKAAFSCPKKYAEKNYSVLNRPTTQFLNWDFELDPFPELYKKHELYSVLIEAGPSLSQKYIESNVFSEIVLYLNTSLLGGINSHAFKDPFGEGFLPGKKLKISSIKQLSSEDIVIRLVSPN